MRDSQKITIPYQMWRIVFAYLIALFVSLFFQGVLLLSLMVKPVAKEIISAIFILVEFGVIYSEAWNCAKVDMKPYSSLEPNMKKSFVLGIPLAVITFIFMMGSILVWHFCAVDGSLEKWWQIAINGAFILWTFPFFGIMELNGGMVAYTWYAVTLMYAIPLFAPVLGYYAGIKKFVIADKILRFMYVKKDNKKDDKNIKNSDKTDIDVRK